MNWQREKTRGEPAECAFYGIETRDEWSLRHPYAGLTPETQTRFYGGGTKLEIAPRISGGPDYGAKTWPAVTLTVSLPAGRWDLAHVLAGVLRGTVARFIETHPFIMDEAQARRDAAEAEARRVPVTIGRKPEPKPADEAPVESFAQYAGRHALEAYLGLLPDALARTTHEPDDDDDDEEDEET